MDQIEELLTRGIANIIPGIDELRKVFKSGRKLNIYLGIDPTSTQIHLGHAVPLRKLQKMSEMGHKVTFLIGDFTALIGDTSDKESERPVLTSDEINKNFQTYKQQAEKILDFSKVSVKHNSEWLGELKFGDIIRLTQNFSLGDFISRELIRKRIDAHTKIGLHEILYPVMQGYDSYHMDTDLQLGGTDQTFNMQAGRTLVKNLRNKQSYIMSNEFLEGTDGRKMSKTWNNAIWLTDLPQDMYGKIMSLKDELIIQYFLLGTNVSLSEISQIEERLKSGENPMILKKELANVIVSELHSDHDAEDAAAHFESVFQKNQTPADIPIYEYPKFGQLTSINIIDLLEGTKMVTSRSEAKRQVEQKAVTVNGSIIETINSNLPTNQSLTIQIGKKNFLKVKEKQ